MLISEKKSVNRNMSKFSQKVGTLCKLKNSIIAALNMICQRDDQ